MTESNSLHGRSTGDCSSCPDDSPRRVDASAAEIDEAVENGYLLPRDATELQRRAEDAPIGDG